jgi:hypothetical protein
MRRLHSAYAHHRRRNPRHPVVGVDAPT